LDIVTPLTKIERCNGIHEGTESRPFVVLATIALLLVIYIPPISLAIMHVLLGLH
jgi:hypothetical protein